MVRKKTKKFATKQLKKRPIEIINMLIARKKERFPQQ